MGVPLLTAHLFVFYFGVVSDLTPPTAVSCYVAGAIAGESGMRVAFSASRVALPALIVPFMFVYSPALLLKGSALDVIVAGVPALLGLLSMSVALIGSRSRCRPKARPPRPTCRSRSSVSRGFRSPVAMGC
jgi:TRAP-type uncharacterized transport system fused permease subunit